MARRLRPGRPSLLPALVLGFGAGGIVDGILLHEVLELRTLLAATALAPGTTAIIPGTPIVYATVWALTAAGLVLLHRDTTRGVRWSPDRLVGGLALGWGAFNLVEGILAHHVLDLHHLGPAGHALAWDLAYLAFGAVLAILGTALTTGGEARAGTEDEWREAA